MEEALYFKAEECVIYVRAVGHVTASQCPMLKARMFARLDEDPPIDKIFFDLESCEYMDSTFLGLIVGTQKRFERSSHHRLCLLHVSDTCQSLLKTIGVLKMVDLSEEEVPFPTELEIMEDGNRASAKFILETHDDLSELSDENRSRFAALTTVLKNSIDAEEKEKKKD